MNILENQGSFLPIAIKDSVDGGTEKEGKVRLQTFGVSNEEFDDLMEIAK